MGYNGAGKDVWLLCVLMMAWSLLASCDNGEKESDENSANDALHPLRPSRLRCPVISLRRVSITVHI